MARFFGLAVYETADGSIRRDLFSEGQDGLFLTDAVLLGTLARDRLASVAESVQAEAGWR